MTDADATVTATVDPADALELAAVAAATFPLACPPELTPADIEHFVSTNLSADDFTSFLAAPDHHVFKAIDPPTGSIAGYALVVDGDPTDADVLAAVPQRPLTMVSKMYVLPGFHGKHVSAGLMAAALAHAREHGSALVWLGVNEQNLRAQKFYRKMGFDVVGRKTFTVNGTVCHDFIFARTPPTK